MKQYNHMFTIAFEVVNNSEDGSETTNEEILSGIQARLKTLAGHPKELQEAIQPCLDTYEVTESC
jgi:hypothetical protein